MKDSINLVSLTAVVVLIFVGITSVVMVDKVAKVANEPKEPQIITGAYTSYDTFSTATSDSTSTINTTSTQVTSTINKFLTLINRSTSTFTCKADALGTTAPSSTVAAGRGYVIGPHLTTGTNIPSQITFGECWPGAFNCVPFKGTPNCVADVPASVTKISK